MKHALLGMVIVIGACRTPEQQLQPESVAKSSADTAVMTTPQLSDVAIMLPIDNREDVARLPTLRLSDPNLAMIPPHVLSALPSLVKTDEPPEEASLEDLGDSLKVISLRLDHCFRDKPGEGECRPQIRLVAQPLKRAGTGSTTRDAAVHLFFRMTQTEVLDLVESLAMARGEIAETTLNRHPVLEAEGMEGPYAQIVLNAVNRFCVKERLERVAITALRSRSNVWQFQTLDVGPDGTPTPVIVPATESAEQVVYAMGVRPVSGLLTPCCAAASGLVTTENANNITQRLRNPDIEDEFDKEIELQKVDRFENPAHHGPGTVDCVSCHIAEPARALGESLDPETAYDKQFQFRHPLAPESGTAIVTDLTIVRAFGYKSTTPVVSQRTKNETALVLEEIRRLLQDRRRATTEAF